MIWKIILAILLAIGGILVFDAVTKDDPEWKERRRASIAIDLCREDQQKHAGNASALAIIVPTCEKFEADYRSKYGRNP